jgi:archaellum component FlaC
MQVIQTDVKEIKVTLGEHSQILESHSQILERLDAKTDTIAEKVMNHEIRLTKAENDIEELRGGVH